MLYAVRAGHTNIVELMLEAGADDYNWAASEAAKNGYTDIVKLMLDMGATNYREALYYATDPAIIALITNYKGRKKTKLT